MNEPQLLTYKNWIARRLLAQGKPARLLLLIHGWMGDENSMWVLARNLSPKYDILAPRGPFPMPEGGFSWREITPAAWGKFNLEDLQPAADALLTFVDEWSAFEKIDNKPVDLMGFSQGAAMVYTLSLLYPQKVGRIAALSGFIPEGGEGLVTTQRFSGKPVFISHGRQDEIIPVNAARKAMELFHRAEAQVTYCESDGGHKVGKGCLKEMEKFMGWF